MDTAPPSINGRQVSMPSADVRQLCQLQLNRLSEKLPLLDVWLVCWNQLESKRDMISSQGNHIASPQIRSYLESERWISGNLPFLELMSLSLESDNSQAYVCGLGKTNAHWDYLLLNTAEQISHFQRDLVKEYAELLQQYLTLYQENLRQRAKIQLLEQALQQADHQLRNPLALISLYAKNIELGAETETQRQQAGCIGKTVDTISTNLSGLLNCGKQVDLRREHYHLSTLWQDAIELLSPRIADKQLSILQTILQPEERPVVLVVDGWQVTQVFQNLLDNAIYFSPPGGTITIDWQVSPQGVLITVGDQGPGLGDMTPAELFDPFYSRRYGGTGLGLAIAKKIILDHQGSIDAETLLQGGAKFSIFLPCQS
ncbi:sensor histidine kinase [Leptothoe sp. PORK10 BA2]|uniref:sensor histidine kinase n=1 Tax=Leptothoe sp. PORK10 BA2 TaxID=3110254 RepID=UPI002B20D304|nr:HAMP domain-containing sensor histidine kinase [Leptothoe sp. PORK10 BA2]MEA5466818.1 HAMP domain-containing sensor histidine kinase [Leptothoe sp. PORK10 BA2]